jgi:transcriptional regulator with XRE-family HTH domain
MLDKRLQKIEDLRSNRQIKIEGIAKELGLEQMTIYNWLREIVIPSEFKIVAIDALLFNDNSKEICDLADRLNFDVISRIPQLVKLISDNVGISKIALENCNLKRVHRIAIAKFIFELIQTLNINNE